MDRTRLLIRLKLLKTNMDSKNRACRLIRHFSVSSFIESSSPPLHFFHSLAVNGKQLLDSNVPLSLEREKILYHPDCPKKMQW
jgi:hypothetical protein